MTAFEGMEPPARILEWLRQRPLAGFTLFRHLNVGSPAQVRAMVDLLQETAVSAGHPPLLIAADQEGGQLMAMGDAMTQFPGNMALGATRDPELAREVGQAMGRELAAMGVNINYAPVCDLLTHALNPSLGVRAFSDDTELTAVMAAAMVKGIQSAGVAATVKHFPGKGEAAVDSHYSMPLIDRTKAELLERELRPFQATFNAGVKMVMSGHFALPSITGSDVPATLSRAAMHDLLREEMGFDGISITDALDMGAITQGEGQIHDIVASICAGVDLMLMTADAETQERIYTGLETAVSNGDITAEHLDDSIARINALKAWVSAAPQPNLDVIGCDAHQALSRKVAQQSVTLVRNDADLLPLKLDPSARIAAIMPQPKDLTPADTSSYVKPMLAQSLRTHHAHVDEFIVSHEPTDGEIEELKTAVSTYDLLIVGTISAALNPQQAKMANVLLKTGIPTVNIALRIPYDLSVYPDATTYVCTYSIQPHALDALADGLWGKRPFVGKLPVKMALTP